MTANCTWRDNFLQSVFYFHDSPITTRERNDRRLTCPAIKLQTGRLKDKMFSTEYTQSLTGLSNVNTIIIHRLISYKSNSLVLNTSINTKTSKPVCLCLSALYPTTVDSKTDESLSERSRTQRTVQ